MSLSVVENIPGDYDLLPRAYGLDLGLGLGA